MHAHPIRTNLGTEMSDIRPVDQCDPDCVEAADRLLHVVYPGSEHQFEPQRCGEDVPVLLAYEASRAGGLVTATFVHDGWEPYGLIDQLVVVPELRRRGIGRQLVVSACELLVRRGAVVVFVTTNTAEAEHFYRHVGFAPPGPWLASAPGNPGPI